MGNKKAAVAIGIGFVACLLAGAARAQAQGPIFVPPASQKAAQPPTLAQAVQQAQVVFVATVSKVAGLGGAPATLEVTVKDPTLIKGPELADVAIPLVFGYAAAEGRDFVPKADQKVLVLGHYALAGPIIGGPPSLPGQARQVGTKLVVLMMVEATDANVAEAKKIVGPRDPKARLALAVQSAERVFTATVQKAVTYGTAQPAIMGITVKDVTMLKGGKPAALECPMDPSLSSGLTLTPGSKILVAAHPEPEQPAPLGPNSVSGRNTNPLPVLGGNGPPIFFIVQATDENIALATKALAGGAASQPTTGSQPSGGCVTGTVVKERAGGAVANAKVELRTAKGKVLTSVQTDAQGGFVFEGVPAGEGYVLRAFDATPRAGAEGWKKGISVEAGKATDAGAIVVGVLPG